MDSPAPSVPATPTPREPVVIEHPVAEPASSRKRGRWWTVLLLLLIAAAVAIAFLRLQADLQQLRQQMAQAQAEALAAVAEQNRQLRLTDSQLNQLREELQQWREQRASLDQLYQDLSRSRDEVALLEVERLIRLASQELSISGNVAAGLAALQAADARLQRLDKPAIVALRQAIARDVARLRAAPIADLTGIAVKIDQLIQAVDEWPLLADPAVRPITPPSKNEPNTAAQPAATEQALWPRVRTWLRAEFGDLLRLREVDTPEALLLTAEQQNLVRQQMRLRLLEARYALLMRNERLFRADLNQAQALITRYFDGRRNTVAAAETQLKQLANSPLTVEVPQINDSQNALRVVRPEPR